MNTYPECACVSRFFGSICVDCIESHLPPPVSLCCTVLSSVSGVEWTSSSTIKPNWLFVFCGSGWAGGPGANYQPIQSHQCSQREANTHTHNVNLAPVVLFQLHCLADWLVDLLHQACVLRNKQILIFYFGDLKGFWEKRNLSYFWQLSEWMEIKYYLMC